MSEYSFFKYRTINKNLLDSLVKSQLYFAPRNALNDPFDCNIDIVRVVDHLIATQTDTEILEEFRKEEQGIKLFHENISSLGICSFSLKSNETLMWSHYADDQKGVCLRYEFEESFLDNEDEILGVSRVAYEKNAISNWLKTNIHLFKKDQQAFIINLLTMFLTSKAPSWLYEEEARIIRPTTGLYEIPRKSLTHIIFGLRTTEGDEALLRSIAEKYYSGVEFGRIFRTHDDFGINAEEI